MDTGRMAPADGMIPRRTSHMRLNTRGSDVNCTSFTLRYGRTALATGARPTQPTQVSASVRCNAFDSREC